MKQRRRQCAELQRTLYELFPMFDIFVNKINESTTSSYLIAHSQIINRADSELNEE